MSETGVAVLVTAKVSTVSIVAGNIYEWHAYIREDYEKYNESPPLDPKGTLTGLNGLPPTCVYYPRSAVTPIDFDGYLDWI
jgi:hypothetical protein